MKRTVSTQEKNKHTVHEGCEWFVQEDQEMGERILSKMEREK